MVLVVEDDASAAEIAAAHLRERAPVVVTSGREAMAWIREHGLPEAMVTDVCMEHVDGVALVRWLREVIPGGSALPIVATSGLIGSDSYTERELRGYGVPLVPKPYRRAELLAALDAAELGAIR